MEFTVVEVFNASPEQVYKTWLTSEGHSGMTGGSANISDKVGEKWSAWDGYISGSNLELTSFSRILQSWRTTEFAENEADSRLEILLKEVNGQTELTLIHTQLPAHGAQYEQGWDDHYFTPMKAYFSK